MLLETRVLNVNIGRMDVMEYLYIAYYSNIGIRIRGKVNLLEVRVIKYKCEIQRIFVH